MRGVNQDNATPYCRCRVLYLGSSVPHASKEGLLGVQEPLRELYPEQGAIGARGIDSWLSVWSNGLLLENVDEHRKKITRFFQIEALHYCAAVRHVKGGGGGSSGGGEPSTTRFLPLDSPFARTPSANHPPLFAAVLRRTSGIKVLECHAFICKRDMAANALVRCCFHAYADSSYAKGLDPASNGLPTFQQQQHQHQHQQQPSSGSIYHTLGGSSTTLDSPSPPRLDASMDDLSLYNGNENHKVWARGRDEVDGIYQEQGTLRSTRGSRPRQLVAPPPPPPPPPPSQPLIRNNENEMNTGRKTMNNKKLKKRNRGHEEILQQQQHHHQIHQHQQQQQQQQAIYTNGHGHHTLGHPVRQRYHHQQQHHPHQMSQGSSRSVAGTLARPGPVLLVPAATLPRKAHHGHPRGIRPIPAATPIVPIYAPLPVPPNGAMFPGGSYGTMGANRSRRHPETDTSTLGGASRRLTASHADLTAPDQNQDETETESRFGTGIYRRKGHLNERAFSYSIRAEHRSRSHGSLASLGFSAQNGGTTLPKEDKKDREIAQLVAGLNLDEVGERRNQQHSPTIGPYSRAPPGTTTVQPQPQPRPRPR